MILFDKTEISSKYDPSPKTFFGDRFYENIPVFELIEMKIEMNRC